MLKPLGKVNSVTSLLTQSSSEVDAIKKCKQIVQNKYKTFYFIETISIQTIQCLSQAQRMEVSDQTWC